MSDSVPSLPSRTPAPPLGPDAQNAATDEGASGRKHKTTACEECKKKKLKVCLLIWRFCLTSAVCLVLIPRGL